jgi:hypothetical protein
MRPSIRKSASECKQDGSMIKGDAEKSVFSPVSNCAAYASTGFPGSLGLFRRNPVLKSSLPRADFFQDSC